MCGKDGALTAVEVVGSAADLSRPERAGFRRRAGFLRGAARVRGWPLGRGRGALRYRVPARPLDGPASFYRKWCEQYLQGTAAPSAHGAIRLESK